MKLTGLMASLALLAITAVAAPKAAKHVVVPTTEAGAASATMAEGQSSSGPVHSTTLNWLAPAAQTGFTVTGYNVYRASGACSASMTWGSPLNASPLAATTLTYQDTAVTAGSEYCYTVTSVATASGSTVESPKGQAAGGYGTWQVVIPVYAGPTQQIAPPGVGSNPDAIS
ncbi:MAG: hypothetical protein ACRD8A_12770 [Candidatus Acidiferrales bacterium]